MSHQEFDDILASITALTPGQVRRLARELESRVAATGRRRPGRAKATAGPEAEETAFDVASRAGLIGCIKGALRSPTDLSTNPKHMEGFGRE